MSTTFSLSVENEQADAGRPNLSRETKFSGANGDRGKNIFRNHLITTRIDNRTRLTHALLKCSPYIHTYCTAETSLIP